MKTTRGAFALAVIAAIAVLAPTANAQHRDRYRDDGYYDYYNRPGTSVRIFRIPPGGYHYGGVNIYRLRDYPVWPYAYPPTYRWPYGGITYIYPPRHHRHPHHVEW